MHWHVKSIESEIAQNIFIYTKWPFKQSSFICFIDNCYQWIRNYYFNENFNHFKKCLHDRIRASQMTELINICPLLKSSSGFKFCEILRCFAQVNSFYLEQNVEKPHNIAGVPQSRVNERKSGIIRCCRIAHVTVLFLQLFSSMVI